MIAMLHIDSTSVTLDGLRYDVRVQGRSVWAVSERGDVFYRWPSGKWAIKDSWPLAFVSSPTLIEGLEEAYRGLGS